MSTFNGLLIWLMLTVAHVAAMSVQESSRVWLQGYDYIPRGCIRQSADSVEPSLVNN